MTHDSPSSPRRRPALEVSCLVLLIAGASAAGCGGPLPPMHPTPRLAGQEARYGQRLAAGQGAADQCEAADALERSASLYEKARWRRRAERLGEAAALARQGCPLAAAPVAAAAPAAEPLAAEALPQAPPAPAPAPQPQPQPVAAEAPASPQSVAAASVTVSLEPAPAAPQPVEAPAAPTSPQPPLAVAPPSTPAAAPASPESGVVQVVADPAFHRHIQDARDAHEQGRYGEVLNHLLAAWHIQQEPAVLFNIAVCYEHLEQYEQALSLYYRLADHPQLGPMAAERIAALSQRSETVLR